MSNKWSEIEQILDQPIQPILEQFSDEEKKLKAWIESAPDSAIASLLAVYSDRWFNDVVTKNYFREIYNKKNGAISPIEREVAAILLIHELREYAGNTFNIFTTKPHYEATLAKVHERLGARSKTKVPKVATVRARETSIATMLLQEAINTISLEEIENALAGSDLEATKENKKKILLEALGSAGFAGVAKIVGKKVIKEVVLKIVEKYATKVAGEKAVQKVIEAIAKKVPQKLFQGAMWAIGLGLALKDIYDIAGEATRITVPFVAGQKSALAQ